MERRNDCDPFRSSHLLSNTLHDLGVYLQRSGRDGRALDAFGESLRTRMDSIRRRQQAESESGARDDANPEAVLEKYQDTVCELNELRDRVRQDEDRQGGGEGDEDPSRLDLFPLPLPANDLNAAFFMPPIPRLVELGWVGVDLDSRENDCRGWGETQGHNVESARTLLNMALCHLSMDRPDYRKAAQYLSMSSQACPNACNERPLLAADIAHAEAVLVLAEGDMPEAERFASDALNLYSDVAFGNLRRTSEERRRGEEGAADALSLLLRVYYLAGRRAGALRTGFNHLLRLRAGLHGPDSLRVAATLYNLGVALLRLSSQQHPSEGAMEFIGAFARHPLLLRRRPDPRDDWRLDAHRAEAARALEALSTRASYVPGDESDDDDAEDLEAALGVKFHVHAGAA